MPENAHKHFYIFRHGECPFNVTGHIQGQSHNGDLTLQGCSQAEEVGRRLSSKKIDVIISSPMRRAMQTAKIVQRYLKVPILVDKRFIEVNMGVVEGMHLSVAEKKYPEVYRRWRNNNPEDTSTRFENGETKAEVRKRIYEALNYYAKDTPYQHIAISGHGITISQILFSFDIARSNIPNGSIVHLLYHHPKWEYAGFIEA